MRTADRNSYRWRWANVDESGRAADYKALLNRLRPDDEPANFPNTLAWIDAQPGERILEAGCGNGAVARAVCRAVPDVAELVAVDASREMIAEARSQSGGGLPVAFAVADATHLPFPDASFDRVYAMETFVILPDPRRALEELARVTRPGGRLCLWESDCDAHAILANDLELSRRLFRYVGDCEFNGAAGRQLIGWLKEFGWDVGYTAAVGVSDGSDGLGQRLLGEWLADAVEAGVLSQREAVDFDREMGERRESGRYLSYLVSFRITARKPA